MDIEIESLLFKQVQKPKNHLITKVINVFDNYYRINVYIEIEENNLTKRKIAQSYFARFIKGNLTIIPDPDKPKEGIQKKL